MSIRTISESELELRREVERLTTELKYSQLAASAEADFVDELQCEIKRLVEENKELKMNHLKFKE